MTKTETTKERFWSKVVKLSGDGACWLWGASLDQNGYGILGNGDKITRAHRISWEIAHGPIPKGASVLHKCDQTACVNPAHLFLGTQKENMQDAAKKNRLRHKLSIDQVQLIRDLFSSGMMQRDIGQLFSICQPHVSRIVRFDRRPHVATTPL